MWLKILKLKCPCFLFQLKYIHIYFFPAKAQSYLQCYIHIIQHTSDAVSLKKAETCVVYRHHPSLLSQRLNTKQEEMTLRYFNFRSDVASSDAFGAEQQNKTWMEKTDRSAARPWAPSLLLLLLRQTIQW